MKYLISIVIGLIFLVSCEEKNDSEEVNQNISWLYIPTNDSIDVNSDNVIDFVIDYRELHTDDIPSSRGSIIRFIKLNEENQILCRNPEGYLFLNIHDTIKKNDNTNSVWSDYAADIISIGRDYQNWDRYWTIISKPADDYFLGFKLRKNNSEVIGWLLLNFDLENGEVTIQDQEITNSDQLIIQR